MAPVNTSRRRARRAPALSTLALGIGTTLLASCTAGEGTGLDANGRPPGESGAGQPPPAAGANDFRAIQDTILTPICTACHAGASAPLGLRLDSANSYAALVNVASVQVSSLRRVLPGDPGNSYLVQKMEGRAAVGSRMPLGGPPLTQASIDLVRAWIAAGARPPATAQAPQKLLVVSSTIPATGEIAVQAVREITVVFNDAVDASLVGIGGAVQLIDERTGAAVALQSISVQPGNATVLKLRTAAVLAPGSYELQLRGQGSPALASVDGHVLDGDADGRAGGDFSAAFLVVPAPASGGSP